MVGSAPRIRSRRAGLAIGLAVAIAWTSGVAAQGPPSQAQAPQESIASRIDKVFERLDRPGSPGCAVGVAQRGRVVYTQGYGMANLEYGVRIRPETIFESGSVAKQFTASAIALLVQDGKLSLQDPVRKYVPELPDFGTPITIQHFLNHTSGLRSQWPMLALAGRPPGLAVHTVDEILELVGGYTELNFKPGDEYLYNNTAFTLLGVVVARVSGKSLNAFTQERLFTPLGMTHTRWRDGFTTVVEGRATAYRPAPGGQFRTNMPFTNVIGNGGLLSTVGDWLIWNENLDNPRIGGQAMVEQLQTRGRLNDGFVNEYAQGLIVTDHRGVREISHGGSTAGYQTFLARWPDDRLSVAVMCNTSGTNPSGYAHQVAELFLGDKLAARPTAKAIDVPVETLQKLAGVYREVKTDAVVRIAFDEKAKAIRAAGAALVPTAPNVWSTADGARTFTVADGPAGAARRITESDGRSRPRVWDSQPPFTPTETQLAEFAGAYFCPELQVTYTVFVDGKSLKIRFRPAQRVTLEPLFPDGFEADGNTVRFTRTAAGKIDGFRVYAGRVWHLRFVRK
jgi:CubicO group peptidase (beta-lactamase class C family)